MSYHFFKITSEFNDKNQLYKEFREFVKIYDQCLIKSSSDVPLFKNRLKACLEHLNEKHKRCKPIQLSEHLFDPGRSNLYVTGSWYASIYEVKTSFTGENQKKKTEPPLSPPPKDKK